MKKYDAINPVNNLPDRYAKDENSNNYKILFNEKAQLNAFAIESAGVFDSLDLETATGNTLDLYGEMLNQPRGFLTDAQYRLLLRAKIMRNLSNGNYLSVVNAICMTFNCKPSEVSIVEKEDVPCAIEVATLPLPIINKAGLTITQTLEMIKGMLPVCVSIDAYSFEGTFEFGDAEFEPSETSGFANDEQTIGGYFGAIGEEKNETILPIN